MLRAEIVNSVCWSHALVNGPTSKMPASDGGLCIGQLLMMPYSRGGFAALRHLDAATRAWLGELDIYI